MSSGGPPQTPTPAGFRPGDRVRVREGMFASIPGEVLGPDPRHPCDLLVRLRIWGRDVDVALQPRQIESAPPAD